MKNPLLSIFAILLLAGCAPSVRAPKAAPAPPLRHRIGYRIAGDKVIFEFHPREFTEATSGPKQKVTPLAELRIHSVAVAGEFNRWSTTAWPMTLAGSEWVTTQGLDMFDTERPLAFKFVVNSEYWVEPPVNALNRATPRGSTLHDLMLELHHAEAPPAKSSH